MSNFVRRCHECGQPLEKKDLFCPHCGAKQPRDPKQFADRRAAGSSIRSINE